MDRGFVWRSGAQVMAPAVSQRLKGVRDEDLSDGLDCLTLRQQTLHGQWEKRSWYVEG